MSNGHKTAEAYEMTILRERGTLRRGIVGADGSVEVKAHSGFPDQYDVNLKWDGRAATLCSLRLMKSGWEVAPSNMLLLAIAMDPAVMQRLAGLTEALFRGADKEAREHGLTLEEGAKIAADHLAEDAAAYDKK